jgi:hypothetical protein
MDHSHYIPDKKKRKKKEKTLTTMMVKAEQWKQHPKPLKQEDVFQMPKKK